MAAKKTARKKATAKKAVGAAKPLAKKLEGKPASFSPKGISGHRARKKGKSAAKKPPGRPSTYDPVVFFEICRRLSKGEPLTIICGDEGMPCDDTVRNWAQGDEGLAKALGRARERGFDTIAMEILTIADNSGHEDRDTIATDFGDIPNKEWILRSKLRCEMRLKLLSKWDPKRYGDKVTAELTGKDGGAIRTAHELSPELQEEILARTAEAAAIAARVQPPASFEGRDRDDG